MEAEVHREVQRAAAALDAADALLITAGAGMGVDSGLPDFRGAQGFWRAYPAIAKLGITFEEMASPSWFEADPHLAWAFYGHRLNLYRNTTPHPGFTRLLEISRTKAQGSFVFTSNVDGQFQRAGFAPDQVVECHGSIHHLQCIAPCSQNLWEATKLAVSVDEAVFRAQDPLPRCPNCSALARPNILMFGDWSWISGRSQEQQRRFAEWSERLIDCSARIVVIELGAGSSIPTVRRTSEHFASRTGGTLIRINPREHDVPPGHIGLPLRAAEGILRICGSNETSNL